jgi:DNA-binding XRE family transcriptional regulator
MAQMPQVWLEWELTMNSSGWSFRSETEKQEMEEEVTKTNCGGKLKLVQRISSLSRRGLAKILGVSEATLRRIENRTSLPTDEFMDRLRALCVIGRARFEMMSEAEKEKVSDTLGASGGVIAGVGGALGAVSASGAVAGLSASGITSGLAAIGGGTMLGGIAVVAAIPVVTGLAGYGLVRGIKAICIANKLGSKEVNGRWEIKNSSPPT